MANLSLVYTWTSLGKKNNIIYKYKYIKIIIIYIEIFNMTIKCILNTNDMIILKMKYMNDMIKLAPKTQLSYRS